MNELTLQELSNSDLIRSRIFTIRGVQVMLDRDLAELYGVATKVLNQAVKRNIERFPERYMFDLNKDDVANMRSQIATGSCAETSLRSQIVTLNKGQGKHLKYMPYAFTEQGIAMLSAVLKSETAIQVSLKIMDAFVAMRKALASIAPLLARIEATDRRQIADQAKNDANQERNEELFKLILDAMQDKKFPPQKVFFDGQVYDAFEQMKKFVRMAKKEILSSAVVKIKLRVNSKNNFSGTLKFTFSITNNSKRFLSLVSGDMTLKTRNDETLITEKDVLAFFAEKKDGAEVKAISPGETRTFTVTEKDLSLIQDGWNQLLLVNNYMMVFNVKRVRLCDTPDTQSDNHDEYDIDEWKITSGRLP